MKAKDNKDFTAILAEYGPLLSRIASSYEAKPELQQELLQEISLAVWQSLQKFKGDSQLKTYILRIAHNRAVTHVSKEIRTTTNHALEEQDAVEQLYSSANVETEVENADQVKRLLFAVRKLSVPARQVFTLSLEGLSYQDIAQVTGQSQSNVGAIISRSKATVLKEIQGE